MQILKALFLLVAVKLCDSHGHFSHQSIFDTSLSGLFSGVNKVHEVASAVVNKFPGLNVNFESNVQVAGGHYRPQQPQYPAYNQPQKKPEEVVIVIVDEGSGGNNGQQPPQYPPPPQHSRPPSYQGQNPSQQGHGYYPGHNPNYQQGYKPNQNYAPNNNYQPNFQSNDQPNFPSNNHQHNYANHNNHPQEDCEHNENPNAGRPQPGHGYGGGFNQYPNYDNNRPSFTTPQAQPTQAPVTTPKWHDNQNTQTNSNAERPQPGYGFGGGYNQYPNYDNNRPSFTTTEAPVTTPKWHDNQNSQTFPTASPKQPTDYTSHNQQPGQGPNDQGYQKPVDQDDEEKNKIESNNKPAGNDEPLLVPLNPNEYVYGGDHIMITAPKRETQKETSTKTTIKEEDVEFPIDIRFGD